MQSALILFALLQACDGWTTWHVLRFGGREVWWPTKWVMDRLDKKWTLILFKVGLIAGVWYAIGINQMPLYVLLPMCGGYAVVVYLNWKQLQIHKEK